jgi:NAD(P)-dependent dehydrogenase (short-subunit alcohol dehydrogenase family)
VTLRRAACRTEKKALEARESILSLCPGAKGSLVEFMQLDLASFKSVRAFAAAFKARKLPLHVLVNNAGVMQHERLLTSDGNEMTLQANYLGHFLLTDLLLGCLKDTASRGGQGARIVNISSSMHWVRARPARASARPLHQPTAHDPSPFPRRPAAALSGCLSCPGAARNRAEREALRL